MSIGKLGMIGRKDGQAVDPYALPVSVPPPLARWVITNPDNVIDIVANKITTLIDVTGNGYDATATLLNDQLDVTGDIASGKMSVSPPLLVAGTDHTQLVWMDNPLLSLVAIDATIFSWYENNHIRIQTNASTLIVICTSSSYYSLQKSAYPATTSQKVLVVLRSEHVAPTAQWQSAYIVTDNASIFQTAPPIVTYPTGSRPMNIAYIGENLFTKVGFKVHDIAVMGSVMTDQQILDYYNATKGNYGL